MELFLKVTHVRLVLMQLVLVLLDGDKKIAQSVHQVSFVVILVVRFQQQLVQEEHLGLQLVENQFQSVRNVQKDIYALLKE
jgi:hypothetical protein